MGRQVLGRDFFERSPDVVARELVGAIMVVRQGRAAVRVRIEETEAYGGFDDPASHAFRGPTKRAAIMFGEPGMLYVYQSYGVHWCMNVVTERVGTAGAVLIRAGEIEVGRSNELTTKYGSRELRGPGILTRELGITGADNGIDCCQDSPGRIRFERFVVTGACEVGVSPRVGISHGQERLSRYFRLGGRAVSKRSVGRRKNTTRLPE
jgi:DNA-3-methyladenine glycosylase